MLSVVPTPLGNREDMTLRALTVLKNADAILCEDTRHSGRLLAFYSIDKPLIALHDHNEAQRIQGIIERLKQGENFALISDAGMPLISDPGYKLLQAVLAEGLDYTILPGPSAVITALAGSGLPTHSFHFGGFLPVKKQKRLKILTQSLDLEGTHIFFESPHRLLSTLSMLEACAPSLLVCVARELTKRFETYHRNTPHQLIEHFTKHPPKGEIVLLFSPDSLL